MKHFSTVWADKIDKSCPLPEYPRPQLVRENWMNLNGLYEYAVTGDVADAPEKFDGNILVPYSIESELSGVNRALSPDEILWYRRKFTPDETFAGKRAILRFGAVDWQCKVWVNGKIAGEHTGGYNPFSFDVTDLLVEGENELVVRVFDPTDAGHQQRGKHIRKTFSFWYTATSGIWQTVWLEPVNNCRIESIRLTPDIDKGVIRIETNHTCECCGKITARILDAGNTVFEGEISADAEISVPDAKLWSPENPFLYDLYLTLECDGEKD